MVLTPSAHLGKERFTKGGSVIEDYGRRSEGILEGPVVALLLLGPEARAGCGFIRADGTVGVQDDV